MKMKVGRATLGLTYHLGRNIAKRQWQRAVFRTIDHHPVPNGYPKSATSLIWPGAVEEAPSVELASAASHPRVSLDDVRRALSQSSPQAPSPSQAAQSGPESGQATRLSTPRPQSSIQNAIVQSRLVEQDAPSIADVAAPDILMSATPPSIAEVDNPTVLAETTMSVPLSQVDAAAQPARNDRKSVINRRNLDALEHKPSRAPNGSSSAKATRRTPQHFTVVRTDPDSPGIRRATEPEMTTNVQAEVVPRPHSQLSTASNLDRSDTTDAASGAMARRKTPSGPPQSHPPTSERELVSDISQLSTAPQVAQAKLAPSATGIALPPTSRMSTPRPISQMDVPLQIQVTSERFAADERSVTEMPGSMSGGGKPDRATAHLVSPSEQIADTPGGVSPQESGSIQRQRVASGEQYQLETPPLHAPIVELPTLPHVRESSPVRAALPPVRAASQMIITALPESRISAHLQLKASEEQPSDHSGEAIVDKELFPNVEQTATFLTEGEAIEPRAVDKRLLPGAPLLDPSAVRKSTRTSQATTVTFASSAPDAATTVAVSPQVIQRSPLESFTEDALPLASKLATTAAKSTGTESLLNSRAEPEIQEKRPGTDVQALAREVSRILRRQIRLEKERFGNRSY